MGEGWAREGVRGDKPLEFGEQDEDFGADKCYTLCDAANDRRMDIDGLDVSVSVCENRATRTSSASTSAAPAGANELGREIDQRARDGLDSETRGSLRSIAPPRSRADRASMNGAQRCRSGRQTPGRESGM